MNMRYLWHSLLSVFVLWFALSPVLCYASEMVTTNSSIEYTQETEYPIMPLDVTEDDVANGLVYHQFILSSASPYEVRGASAKDSYVSPFNKTYTFNDSLFYDVVYADTNWKNSSARASFNLYCQMGMVDESVLIDAEKSFELILNGITHQLKTHYLYTPSSGGTGKTYAYYPISKSGMSGVAIEYYGTNSEVYTEWLDASYITQGNGFFGFKGDLTAPDFDVKYIQLVFSFDRSAYNYKTPTVPSGATYDYANRVMYETKFTDGVMKIKVQDENTGLLKGIVQWLKSIKDGITELPNKIWSTMENGIKGLFVPSEEDMVLYKDKWDELLSQRFGVVYQSGTIITDTLGTITEQSAQGTINLPATTISFAATDFTFGGYDVPVVPQGFEWLVEIIKGLIDIVITVAFINAMRTKYDQLMRG